MLFRSLLLHLGLSLLMGTPSPSAVAQVHVGPHDGMVVESLPAVPLPSTLVEERLPDTRLPKLLEEQGNWGLAAIEWQRLALQSTGAMELAANLHAAIALNKAGTPTAAAHVLEALLREAPNTDQTPQILYHLTRTTTGVSQTEALAKLAATPANPWARAALWANVVQQAHTGPLTKTYNLPEAEELRTVQAAHAKQAKVLTLTATAAGVVPGLGHVILGDAPQGSMIFLFTSLFALAFLSACRHRHYAYAFLLVIPAVSLWLNSPLLAHAKAVSKADATWQTTLKVWENRIPEPAFTEPTLATPALPQPATTQQQLPPLPTLVQQALQAPMATFVSVTGISPTLPRSLSVPVLKSRPAQ